jgi:acetyl esterase/lipase
MKTVFSSRIFTVFFACLSLPLSIIMIAVLLHVPVLSVPAFLLIPSIPRITVLFLFLAAVALPLYKRQRTHAWKIILFLILAGLLICMIIDGSELLIAGKQNVRVDLKAAFQISDGDTSYDGDVSYLNYEGKDYALSIWLPKNTEEKSSPILLWIHGGSWVSGSRHDSAAHCRYFSEHGYLVASVEYPLSTDETHLYDIQQGAVAKAVQWLKHHAASIGGDTGRLYLGGSSAGGNLAVAVAARINKGELDTVLGESLPKVRAVTTCFPAIDPAGVYYKCDPVFRSHIHNICKTNWGGTPAEYPERYEESTGAVLTDSTMAPTLMLYGKLDHLIHYSTYNRFIERMAELGVGTSSIVFPFSDHGCDVSGTVECQVWRQKTLEWFEKY